MDRDSFRYIPNSYQDDNFSNLLENRKLNRTLHDSFIAQISSLLKYWEEHFKFDPNDTSVYTGASGGALLYLKILQTNIGQQLSLSEGYLLQKAQRIVDQCLEKLKRNRSSFICGCLGPLTIKAIVGSLQSEVQNQQNDYYTEIASIALESLKDPSLPDEILYGRAGILYSLLLIRSKLAHSEGIISDQLIRQLVTNILHSGKNNAKRKKSGIPLVYYWHEKAYIGAAHGYAGILYILLEARQYLTNDELNFLVKPTINFVLSLQFSQSGNFPSSLRNPDELTPDTLVQWCHGSPGVIHLLVLAYQVFNETKYLDAAVRCSDDIWTRGILKKGSFGKPFR